MEWFSGGKNLHTKYVAHLDFEIQDGYKSCNAFYYLTNYAVFGAENFAKKHTAMTSQEVLYFLNDLLHCSYYERDITTFNKKLDSFYKTYKKVYVTVNSTFSPHEYPSRFELRWKIDEFIAMIFCLIFNSPKSTEYHTFVNHDLRADKKLKIAASPKTLWPNVPNGPLQMLNSVLQLQKKHRLTRYMDGIILILQDRLSFQEYSNPEKNEYGVSVRRQLEEPILNFNDQNKFKLFNLYNEYKQSTKQIFKFSLKTHRIVAASLDAASLAGAGGARGGAGGGARDEYRRRPFLQGTGGRRQRSRSESRSRSRSRSRGRSHRRRHSESRSRSKSRGR